MGAKYPETGLNFISGIVDEIPNISVISKIEVLSFRTTEAEYQFLKRFCNDALMLELNEEIIDKTIDIRIANKLKTPDAIIAATALVHNMVLITRNVADFQKVPGLTVINPFEL